MLSQSIEELSSDDEFSPKKRPARAVTTVVRKPSAMVDIPSPAVTGTSKRKALTTVVVESLVDEVKVTALITPPNSKKRKTANANHFEATVYQTPTKATSAVQAKAVKAVNSVPRTAARVQRGKNSSRTADKIRSENFHTGSPHDDTTPVKIEAKVDRLQELNETITKLAMTVQEQASTIAKLTDANAKSADSAAKLVDSNNRLVKRNAELLGRPSVVEAVERERVLDQREAELEVNVEAAAERLDREGKQVWHHKQAMRYWEMALQARSAKLDNAAPVQRETTQPSVYEAHNLDIYKTDRVSHLPADDPLAEQLVRLWERKVAAVLGNKPLSKYVGIPDAVIYSSWRNHPIVHCFKELDMMWQYLDNVTGVCTHLVHSKSPILLFADQMRNFPVVDAELWLLRADNVLENLAQKFEADEIEARGEPVPQGPSTLKGRRQRRFRAFKRDEALSILADEDDSRRKYRLAKVQAETFAIQEDFDEVL
ncbi:hypothetical protein LTR95_014607 [Oleoguttula sp. CCFEE 5521]